MSTKTLKGRFEEDSQEEDESDCEQSEQQDEDGDDKEDESDDEEEDESQDRPEQGEDEEIQYPQLTVESYELKITEAMVSWLIPDLANIVKGYLNSGGAYFASAPVTGNFDGGIVTLFGEEQFRELDQETRENGCQRTTGLDFDDEEEVCGDPIERLYVDFDVEETCLCAPHAQLVLAEEDDKEDDEEEPADSEDFDDP